MLYSIMLQEPWKTPLVKVVPCQRQLSLENRSGPYLGGYGKTPEINEIHRRCFQRRDHQTVVLMQS